MRRWHCYYSQSSWILVAKWITHCQTDATVCEHCFALAYFYVCLQIKYVNFMYNLPGIKLLAHHYIRVIQICYHEYLVNSTKSPYSSNTACIIRTYIILKLCLLVLLNVCIEYKTLLIQINSYSNGNFCTQHYGVLYSVKLMEQI